MASQGPLSPGTLADDSAVGTTAWTSPSNAGASDDSYTTANLTDNASTHYLKATNHAFTVPAGATINGIVVEAEVKAGSASTVIDGPIKLVKAGSVVGTDKARGGSTFWPTSDAYQTWGSSSDLWGTTWTVADVNASNFGAVISGVKSGAGSTGSVDHIRITVHYTLASNKLAMVL